MGTVRALGTKKSFLQNVKRIFLFQAIIIHNQFLKYYYLTIVKLTKSTRSFYKFEERETIILSHFQCHTFRIERRKTCCNIISIYKFLATQYFRQYGITGSGLPRSATTCNDIKMRHEPFYSFPKNSLSSSDKGSCIGGLL